VSVDRQDPLFKPFKGESDPSNKQIKPARKWRLSRLMVGCLTIGVAVILCSGVSLFAANAICYSNLTQRLPIYPNATVKSRGHNFLTEFGMGDTEMVLISPDSPETVRSWYAVHTGSYLRDSLRNNTPFFRMAQGQVSVDYNPDDPTGKGSQIILYGTCVQ